MTDTICPECGSSDRALRESADLVAEVNRLIRALDEAEADVADLRADLARARAAIKQLMAVVGGCCIQAAGEPRCGRCAWCLGYSLTRKGTGAGTETGLLRVDQYG